MPGFDGTGPMGRGSMTGGGRGYCAGYQTPRGGVGGYLGAGRGGHPWGGGRGRAWGGGRGRGWAMRYDAPQYAPSAEDESRYLKDELTALEEEMRAMRQRLVELEGKDEGSK